LITGLLVVVLLAVAAWNGYHYWQRSQAGQSAALFDEMSKSVAAGDVALAQRSFSDMKERYPSATYTQQAAFAVARQAMDKGDTDAAKSALQWVVDKSADQGYSAIARLRLANMYFDAKDYAQALALLDGVADEAFAALVADRKGDIFALQDKRSQAIAAYLLAYQKLEARAQYRRVVQVKLNALGVDPEAVAVPKLAEGLK
jgi:predicted negative regulator of RcsB-dependent stress response